jgi:hypothetical protein
MPRGLPDSWGTYAIGKAARSFKNAGRGRGVTGGITTTYTITKVNVYKSALKTFLNTPAGPLWREVEKRAVLAQMQARKSVGVKTGALRSSIYKRHLGNSTGQYVIIGSDKNYAYAHHEGTKPHIITASSGKNLKFSKNGRMIYTSSVFHPGNRPNRYLTRQLKYFVKPKIVI